MKFRKVHRFPERCVTVLVSVLKNLSMDNSRWFHQEGPLDFYRFNYTCLVIALKWCETVFITYITKNFALEGLMYMIVGAESLLRVLYVIYCMLLSTFPIFKKVYSKSCGGHV